VLLTVEGRRAGVTVAFGEPGEEAVLGATALETLGFMVDPVGKKLVPRNLFALTKRSKADSTTEPRIMIQNATPARVAS
jgi:hypothetical protein